MLRSDVVHAELVQVRRSVVSLAASHRSYDAARTFRNLLDFQTNLSCDPLEFAAASSIQGVWSGIGYLERVDSISGLRLRKLHACAMLTNGMAWRWLIDTLPSAIEDIVVNHEKEHCGWLKRLVESIHSSVLDGKEDVTFWPHDYGLSLEHVKPATHSFVSYIPPADDDFVRWTNVHITAITDIVGVWLDYPTSGTSKWQGIFVLNLVDTLGPEFLVLDVVWNQYLNVDRQLVRVTYIPELLNTDYYPLLNPESDLRKEVEQISHLVEDYATGRLYLRMEQHMQGSYAISYVSEALRTVWDQHAISFKQFILQCFVFVFRGEKLSNSKLEELLTKNIDKYSPFREYAPTRLNMREGDGPFSWKYLQTLSGLFSALVCRGVTFGTAFSRHGRTVFHSPSDFDNAVKSCPQVQQLTDFCDSSAYGGSNPKRKPDLVGIYWSRLRKFPWEGLTTQRPIPFMEAYGYFFPTGKARFLELGPLGSYLLTVDYVYAGLVSPPEPNELANLICTLDKGPARALEYLGLVDPKSNDDDELNEDRKKAFPGAFLSAYKLVKDSIPGEYHQEAGIDIFVVEHALCKFGRANRSCKF